MNTTGRKTVKGEKTSAPKAVKATTKVNLKESSTADRVTAAAAKTAPSFEEIAQRSYELYLQRGGVDGYHEQDWLQAEAELSSR